MSYLGKYEQRATNIKRFDVTSSTSATHTLTWVPPNEQSIIVTINGIKQHEDAYSVSGTTLTLTSALITTDKLEVIGIQDVGVGMVPADGVVKNVHINASAAIAKTKLASLDIVNADVNASAAIALSKLATDPSNASNLASGTVPTARLGSGTADATTFLRGDNAWAAPSGGKVLQVVTATYSTETVMSSTSFATSGLSCSITPAATANKILILYSGMCRAFDSGSSSGRWYEMRIYRVTDTTELSVQSTSQVDVSSGSSQGYAWTQGFTTLDSPSTTSSVEYRIDGRVLIAAYRLAMNNQASDSTLTLLEIEG